MRTHVREMHAHYYCFAGLCAYTWQRASSAIAAGTREFGQGAALAAFVPFPYPCMVTRGASLVLPLALVVAFAMPARARADEEVKPAAPSNPAALQQATQKARFKALVAKAERERRAGRLAEAAEAYAEAFELEQDPLVAGRLGVLLVELGNPTEAADLLLDGIERATDAPAAEREKFLKAYDTARARVGRVEVTVSEAHAEISLDGVVKQTDGITGFTMFLPPGEHELRAKLKGFEDGVVHFTASKGGTLRVELTLLPLPSFKPIEPLERLLRRPRVREPAVNLEEPPNDESAAREPIAGGVVEEQKKGGPRGSVSGGPVVVFGVASWQPAVGAVIAGSLRPNEYVSLGVEARGAWLTSGVGGRQNQRDDSRGARERLRTLAMVLRLCPRPLGRHQRGLYRYQLSTRVLHFRNARARGAPRRQGEPDKLLQHAGRRGWAGVDHRPVRHFRLGGCRRSAPCDVQCTANGWVGVLSHDQSAERTRSGLVVHDGRVLGTLRCGDREMQSRRAFSRSRVSRCRRRR